MKLIVASTNPVKIAAAKNAFTRAFPESVWDVVGVSALSGVADQPMTYKETQQGAENRAHFIFEQYPGADFWVSFEGGLEDIRGHLESVAYVVIKNKEKESIAHTGSFLLPPEVERLVRQGKELADATNIVFNKTNSKHEQGAVGILTNDLIDRVEYYEHACILALIPFLKPDLYPVSVDVPSAV